MKKQKYQCSTVEFWYYSTTKEEYLKLIIHENGDRTIKREPGDGDIDGVIVLHVPKRNGVGKLSAWWHRLEDYAKDYALLLRNEADVMEFNNSIETTTLKGEKDG